MPNGYPQKCRCLHSGSVQETPTKGKNMDIEKQQRAWETFWGETRAIATSSYPEARPIWDSDPDKTALTDLARFKSYMDASLPLVDYGCGNGTQTVCFAQ